MGAVFRFTLVLLCASCLGPPEPGERPRDDRGEEQERPDAGAVDAGDNETHDAGGEDVVRWTPNRPGYRNPIPEENARPGTVKWDRFVQKSRNGELEGYLDRVSASAGERLRLHVSSNLLSTASWTLYRLGWYGGVGAREIARSSTFPVSAQPPCPMRPESGLIRCQWVPQPVTIPDDAPSGFYVFKLERADGFGSLVPLVVTDDRPADLLMQASVTTWQAYNEWGGASLYGDTSGTLPWGAAVEVSFARPYGDGLGSGELLKRDVHFARFLERHGYDVTYTTNVDVSRHGANLLVPRGAFVTVGHDEYWSKQERDACEQARDRGVHLLFFTANAAYWQVRLSESTDGAVDMVGWKEDWREDPDQGPEVTSKFRDPGLERPENGLLGVMFDAWHDVRAPLVVADPSHFLFSGLGLDAGDAIGHWVGHESDRIWSNGHSPAGLQVATRTPVVGVEGAPAIAQATSYRAASGALVFAGATIDWAEGLAQDPQLGRMTANVFEEALGLPIPSGLQGPFSSSARIDGPFATSVQTLVTGLGAPTAVAPLPGGALVVSDATTHRLLLVGPPPSRSVSVIAGTGREGLAGATIEVPAATASFDGITALLTLDEQRIVVADTRNHCLRLLKLGAAPTVAPFAGTCGQAGFADALVPADARFRFPMGLALDVLGGRVLVADSWNHRVRAIDLATGAVSTLAGSGGMGLEGGTAVSARFSRPTAVALGADGSVFVVSSEAHAISRIAPDLDRTVTVLAGGRPGWDDGPGTTAELGLQQGLAVIGTKVYFSDPGSARVRALVPGLDAATSLVHTVAGGRFGKSDGAGRSAGFLLPLGLSMDATGALLVADAEAGSVRRIVP